MRRRLPGRRVADVHAERGRERVRADEQAPDGDQQHRDDAAAGGVVQGLRVLQGADDPADGHGDGDAEEEGAENECGEEDRRDYVAGFVEETRVTSTS